MTCRSKKLKTSLIKQCNKINESTLNKTLPINHIFYKQEYQPAWPLGCHGITIMKLLVTAISQHLLFLFR